MQIRKFNFLKGGRQEKCTEAYKRLACKKDGCGCELKVSEGNRILQLQIEAQSDYKRLQKNLAMSVFTGRNSLGWEDDY